MSGLDDWQRPCEGTLEDEYNIYLQCADDGHGGDIPRHGQPLLTFDEWLNA